MGVPPRDQKGRNAKETSIAQSPFFTFLKSFRNKHKNWPELKLAVEGARRWRTLADEEKRKFEIRSYLQRGHARNDDDEENDGASSIDKNEVCHKNSGKVPHCLTKGLGKNMERKKSVDVRNSAEKRKRSSCSDKQDKKKEPVPNTSKFCKIKKRRQSKVENLEESPNTTCIMEELRKSVEKKLNAQNDSPDPTSVNDSRNKRKRSNERPNQKKNLNKKPKKCRSPSSRNNIKRKSRSKTRSPTKSRTQSKSASGSKSDSNSRSKSPTATTTVSSSISSTTVSSKPPPKQPKAPPARKPRPQKRTTQSRENSKGPKRNPSKQSKKERSQTRKPPSRSQTPNKKKAKCRFATSNRIRGRSNKNPNIKVYKNRLISIKSEKVLRRLEARSKSPRQKKRIRKILRDFVGPDERRPILKTRK